MSIPNHLPLLAAPALYRSSTLSSAGGGGPVVAEKEAVQAFIGSSSAIAGFTLVFLGLVISARSSYDADTPNAVLDRYNSPAIAAVLAFTAGIASIALGAWWLLNDGRNDLVLDILVVVFALQLLLLVASVVLTARRVWSD